MIPTKVVVLLVVSALTVILFYSSVAKSDVFARPPKHIDNLCRDATPTIKGAVTAEVCCQIINGSISVCTKCQYDADGKNVGGCINFYPERQMPGGNSAPPTSAGTSLLPSGNNTGLLPNGQTGPPNRLGTALPSSGNNTNTGTPPALTITKEHNPASPNVLSSTGNPNTNPGQNQQTSGHHHHQGEQNGGTSSSGITNNNPSNGGGNNGKSDNSNHNKK